MEIKKVYTDVLIIGGGAAGLSAAVSFSASAVADGVIVLEKNDRVGKKLLQTGGGKCNIAHKSPEVRSAGTGTLDFSKFHGEREFAKNVVALFNRKYGSYEEYLASLGLWLRYDEQGRGYPASDSAAGVLDTFRLEAARRGAKFMCGYSAFRAARINGGFLVTAATSRYASQYSDVLVRRENSGTGDRTMTAKQYAESVLSPVTRESDLEVIEIRCRRLVLATGGCAAPQTGSTGDGFELAKSLGHNISPVRPSLCPIRVSQQLMKQLKGLRVHAEARALLPNSSGGEKFLAREYGEVQFTENGLSGICIFNLARYAAVYGTKLIIALDLFPNLSVSEVTARLFKNRELMSRGTKESKAETELQDFMTGLVLRRIGTVLLKEVGLSPSSLVKNLSDSDIEALAELIKNWRFKVTGAGSFNLAQCTIGGVPAAQLNTNLSSKICKNLYITGELVNVDGDCGGYNLMWAVMSASLP